VGKVDEETVYVKVDAVDTSKPITSVVVQVRSRGGSTDLDLTQEIQKQIALGLIR
jgi:hypothetical protein